VKVAYFSPMPPEPSGIADYSALLLPALTERIDVEVVPHGQTTAPAGTDVCLYHIGNNPEAHGWIVEALRKQPGVVVLHEFVLHHLVAGLTLARGDGHGYLGAMQREAGVAGRLLAHGVIDGLVAPLWEIRPEDFPLCGEVLEHAAKPGAGLIVHSRYVSRLAIASGYDGRLWHIPHPAWPAPVETPARLPGNPVIGSFGNLNPTKRVPQLLQAFAKLRRSYPDAVLHLVGASAGDVQTRSAHLPDERVVWHGHVGEDELWRLMGGCDICVALRGPTMGETSGSVIRAMSLGKALVVSDIGWLAELPNDVALKVPLSTDEVDVLAAALGLLASDEEGRSAMGEAAARLARTEHRLGRIAEMYAAALEEAAGGEAVVDSVLRELAAAAAAVGLDSQSVVAREAALRTGELGIGMT